MTLAATAVAEAAETGPALTVVQDVTVEIRAHFVTSLDLTVEDVALAMHAAVEALRERTGKTRAYITTPFFNFSYGS